MKISPVAFVAEAALWVTGAALIAGAAGATWSMPNVDLGVLLARPTASPSTGPSPTPVVSAAPSVADKMQAFFANPNLQYEVNGTTTLKVLAAGVTTNSSQTETLDYAAGDVSVTTKLTGSGKTVTVESVIVGQSHYSKLNGGAWTTAARSPDETARWTILFTNREFTDKGVEMKGGKLVHRLEVSDTAAFNSDCTSARGVASPDLRLVFWATDAGTPAAYELSGTYGEVSNGVSESVTIDEQRDFVKTSGITIKAPVASY